MFVSLMLGRQTPLIRTTYPVGKQHLAMVISVAYTFFFVSRRYVVFLLFLLRIKCSLALIGLLGIIFSRLALLTLF